MSWVSNKSEIVAQMSGYKEIPENKTVEEAPSSYNHKAFEIRLGQPDIEELTSSAIISSDLVRIRVLYNNKKASFDENKDSFNDLWESIKTLNKMAGLVTYLYERVADDQYKSVGELEFYYGYRSC